MYHIMLKTLSQDIGHWLSERINFNYEINLD